MWSHYANSHKGYCLGFVLPNYYSDNLYKINYCMNRSIRTSTIYNAVILNKKSSIKLVREKFALSKSPVWKYEDEWRMVGETGLQKHRVILREVIFGLECPSFLKYILVSSLSPKFENIKFYEVYKSRSTYNLIRQELCVGELNGHYHYSSENFHEMVRLARGEK